MSRTTLTIPDDLRDQAKELDINISEVLRHALEAAIPAAKAAKAAGTEFETVTFTLKYSGGDTELVQFIGKPIADGPGEIGYYQTRQGRIVSLWHDSNGVIEDHGEFLVFDDLASFKEHIEGWEDSTGEFHRALQEVETAFGQAPTPRMLDI